MLLALSPLKAEEVDLAHYVTQRPKFTINLKKNVVKVYEVSIMVYV